MGRFMKKTAFLAALLFTWPLLGQNPPATNPPAQNPPAQTPPAQNPPKLEQPPMATPEPEEEKKPAPVKKPDTPTAPGGAKTIAPAAKAAKPPSGEGKMVEEIIARVNNEIITNSELDKARASAEDDARHDCSGKCTPEQLPASIEERQKSALRDLIDQSLLEPRGKDIPISNNLKDMDELEKAVSAQGLNWEDFKNNIRNKILTQKVISQEVGSHITIGDDEALKLYNEHKDEFVRPEGVALRAIEVSTEGKTEAEIPELKKKAEAYLKRIDEGEDFSVLAKRFSDGKTAQQGGYLGVYKRGELAKELEDKVFA